MILNNLINNVEWLMDKKVLGISWDIGSTVTSTFYLLIMEILTKL